jgi:hypothetical protein
MENFPAASRLPSPRPVYKPYLKGNSDFFDQLGLAPADKQLLRQQIEGIYLTHQLDAKTLSIPAGKTVQQIIVLSIDLLTHHYASHLLAELDMRLGQYSLFILRFPDGHEELLIHFKEKLAKSREGRHFKIIQSFQTDKPLKLIYQERDLDQFYENLVKQVGEAELVKGPSSVKDRIEQTKLLASLEKQANQLKKRMFAEKAMRKQMELQKAYKELQKEIEQLKNPQ